MHFTCSTAISFYDGGREEEKMGELGGEGGGSRKRGMDAFQASIDDMPCMSG